MNSSIPENPSSLLFVIIWIFSKVWVHKMDMVDTLRKEEVSVCELCVTDYIYKHLCSHQISDPYRLWCSWWCSQWRRDEGWVHHIHVLTPSQPHSYDSVETYVCSNLFKFISKCFPGYGAGAGAANGQGAKSQGRYFKLFNCCWNSSCYWNWLFNSHLIHCYFSGLPLDGWMIRQLHTFSYAIQL